MEVLGIVSVSAIVVICYLIGQAVKLTPLDNKFIPVICGACGGGIGVAAFLIGFPEFPADNIISAIAVGIVSGFAATGINQIHKQFKQV